MKVVRGYPMTVSLTLLFSLLVVRSGMIIALIVSQHNYSCV